MSERMFAIIGSELNVKPKQVQAAVELLDERQYGAIYCALP